MTDNISVLKKQLEEKKKELLELEKKKQPIEKKDNINIMEPNYLTDDEDYNNSIPKMFCKLGNKRKGRFLEFGATNGKELSNSYLLEQNFEWEGVVAEPSPQWEKSLKENRPRTKIINECIYSESGKMIDFFVSKNGDFSTINEFKESDIETMPGNTKARNEEGFTVKVPTISLNDVFIKHFNGEKIDYMSVDTEGSELLILSKFNFEKFGPKIVTVEHNFTSTQKNLDNLFEKNNYKRFFPLQTQFDSWYIRS